MINKKVGMYAKSDRFAPLSLVGKPKILGVIEVGISESNILPSQRRNKINPNIAHAKTFLVMVTVIDMSYSLIETASLCAEPFP